MVEANGDGDAKFCRHRDGANAVHGLVHVSIATAAMAHFSSRIIEELESNNMTVYQDKFVLWIDL